MDVDDDLRVAQPDHVTVGQLPLLHGRVVDGGAVGGVEVRQQRDVAVPADLQMAARHTGVRQPELGVLAAADDVGAFAQLVGAPTAVVELQGDRGPGRWVAALAVVAVAAGLRGLAVVVVATRRLGVSAARGAVGRSGSVTVTAVVGLLAILLAAVSRPTGIALVVAATLLGVAAPLFGVAAPLFGVAALFVAGRSAAVVGVLAVALATGLAVGALAVAGVITLAAARTLFVLRVAALFGIAPTLIGVAPALVGVAPALVGVAALFGIASTLVGVAPALVGVAAALVGVAALLGVSTLLWIPALVSRRRRITLLVGISARFRRIATPGVLATARFILRMAVVLVVIVVARPPRPLAAAVARIVAHRWYSWFCAERVF